MKISEAWLREWIGPTPSTDVLCECLTMAGLEIEGITPVADEFSGVVVAEVISVEPHPEADRLRVCKVNAGSAETRTIVCGAPNVFAGMKAALATVGAVLPGGMAIRASRLRGVLSEGMLCSPSELGLGEEGVRGLLELPKDAPVGKDLRDYLQLNDKVIEISITPNRGDCLSVAGLSMEIAALNGLSLKLPEIQEIQPQHQEVIPVQIEATDACSRYVGRVIRQVNPEAPTPLWMQERLRRAGVRSISLVVDVTNYVMLEWGQPMHAFDLSTLSSGIYVRYAKVGETLALLDERTVALDPQTLVIADATGPLAIAGVMGGIASGVTEKTGTIFLESAFFNPECVIHSARFYQMSSESLFRFERGIDPLLQRSAIERATALILSLAGGEAGPVIDVQVSQPAQKRISLRFERLKQVAGMPFERETVSALLSRSGFKVEETPEGWQVMVPPRRFDIVREVDLIEEVLRLQGYGTIPVVFSCADKIPEALRAGAASMTMLSRLLCDRGYHEVITYSFVDQKLQALFTPDGPETELLNPITSNMSVMRKTLWPGLISVLLHNLNRQQQRVRVFETGKRFLSGEGSVIEQPVISGLVSGSLLPLQWGMEDRLAGFFDVKGDIEYLLSSIGLNKEVSFLPASHEGLHPGQTADIYRAGKRIGCFGALHPKLLQTLNLDQSAIVFEVLAEYLTSGHVPLATEISKFPMIRRDMAILLDRSIPATVIQDTIRSLGDELLQSVTIFDVYQGKGIGPGKKSVALALVMQHSERTLKDEEVSALMQRIFSGLKESFGAELRG